jgi:hypothetical protein
LLYSVVDQVKGKSQRMAKKYRTIEIERETSQGAVLGTNQKASTLAIKASWSFATADAEMFIEPSRSG